MLTILILETFNIIIPSRSGSDLRYDNDEGVSGGRGGDDDDDYDDSADEDEGQNDHHICMSSVCNQV